jgi:hypothetical protein
MKKSLLFQVLFYFLMINSFGQNKTSIKSVAAYFTVSIPGMQRVDENGNKINPQPFFTRFLYVETKGKAKPFFDTISYNGSLYNSSVAIDSSTVKVGVNVKDGTPIMMKALKGNAIWRIDLQPLNDKQKAVAANANVIIIKGRVDKIAFKINLKSEIELSTPDMY